MDYKKYKTYAGLTVDTSTVSGLGTWKKYNIKPVASKKWNPNIDPIRIKEYFDFFNAGKSQNISTAPDTNAAINTRSHCSQDTGIVHRIDTGMYIERE